MRDTLLVVLVALVALMSGTTLATAEEQSAGEKAVSAPEQRRAPSRVRLRGCEISESGKCLKCKPGYMKKRSGACMQVGDFRRPRGAAIPPRRRPRLEDQ